MTFDISYDEVSDPFVFRGLAQSTRNALQARVSPSAALQQVQAAEAAQRIGNLRAGVDLAPLSVREDVTQGVTDLNSVQRIRGDSVRTFPSAGDVNPPPSPGFIPGPTPLAPLQGPSLSEISDPRALGFQGPLPSEMSTSDRLLDSIERQILNAQAQHEAAIRNGQAEVAAAYADEIARLRDAQAELVAGRGAINAEFSGLQDQLAAQSAQIQQQQLTATGTDIRAEGQETRQFFDTGSESLNETLALIGADSPVLATQLNSDLVQFGELAEQRLRNDLGAQAQVARAGQLFAQKAAQSMIGETQVDSEQARSEIELQINSAIDGIIGKIEQLEADKADALQKVRDQIGEFDITWLQDQGQVWDVYLNEWFKGQGMTFEEEAEARAFFDDVWLGLPTDQRTSDGIRAWARQNMIDANLAGIMQGLGLGSMEELAEWADPNGTGNIQWLLDLAENSGALDTFLSENFGGQWGGEGIEFLSMEDYDTLFDLADIRFDFVNGGYDSFVAEQSAQFAGSGVSPSAINGATLTRSDMTRVTSPSGSVGYLHPGAADSFQRMVADAAADGVQLSFSDTYRSWQTQNQAYTNFLATGTNLAGNVVPNIAHPDHSNHPRGLAVDFNTSPEVLAWLNENASKYGWGPISNEDWHWEYRGSLGDFANVGSTFGGGSATTTTTTTSGTSPSGGAGSGGGNERLL